MKITSNQYKSFYYGCFIALLFIFFDVFFRLNASHNDPQISKIQLPVISNITSGNRAIQDVVSLYALFDVEKTTVAKKVDDTALAPKKELGIGLSKEAQQSGTLTRLYFGENSLSLTGIFSSERRFAVVTITHLANKSVSVKKLRKNQKLFDYTVEAINKKSIDLTRNNQKIKLKLFKK
ncbi:MAG: hypothetical protein JKY81_06900 [Colwellia sp.]|nr:hypothetical protein [Colwellia sp.]